MGRSQLGTVEVQWPGGVRNRLYKVRPGERLILPEIPCSIDTEDRFYRYAHCVNDSIKDLRNEGIISRRHARRLLISAIYAYFEGPTPILTSDDPEDDED